MDRIFERGHRKSKRFIVVMIFERGHEKSIV
jgi:hypothetical protein